MRPAVTRTMNALQCKDKFLFLVDEVAETGETVVIISNGRPVGIIQPYVADPTADRFPKKVPPKRR